MLESESVPGSGRRARYPRSEVERLAARTGKGGRAGSLDVVVDTELTLVDPAGRLPYRGWDVSNTASVALHEAVGFRIVGRRERSAYTPRHLARHGPPRTAQHPHLVRLRERTNRRN